MSIPSPAPSNSLPQIVFSRPLVNLWTVVSALNKSADGVRALVDDGRLVAWNIGCRNSAHRELRILVQSLAAYQGGQPAPFSFGAPDFDHLVKIIFPAVSRGPGGLETVRLATAVRQFSSSHTHLLNLLDEGSLRMVRGTARHAGPNGSPELHFDSVKQFLRDRLVT